MHLATPNRSARVQTARDHLRRRGWKQAEAARHLGVTPEHLCLVLNGRRASERLISRLLALPENPTPA